MKYTDAHISFQTRTTRALLKFCVDHKYKTVWLQNIRRCLKYLERGRVEQAYKEYQRVPLGRMCCFDDWFPPAVYRNETEEYAWAVFEALCHRWDFIMSLSKKS